VRQAKQKWPRTAFPPTYKNGHERLYRFVDDTTEWDRPPYEVWDPARIEDWPDELDAMACTIAS
jgi:hypothetical protein